MKVLLFSDNTNTEALTWCMSKKTVEYCQSRIQLTKPSPRSTEEHKQLSLEGTSGDCSPTPCSSRVSYH